MRILGIDPPNAWAILDVGRVATRIAHGTLDPERDLTDLEKLITVEYCPDLMAIELVERVYPRRDKGGISAAYATELYRSGVAAGDIRRLGKVLGLRVVEVTAEQWRKALCGVAQATDQQVAQMIRWRVIGWPAPGKPGQRTSTEHERDAAGVAIFAGEREKLLAIRKGLNALGRDPLGLSKEGAVRR
jgi:Holliday junction resolvasome RuvABC endonuclease subunit